VTALLAAEFAFLFAVAPGCERDMAQLMFVPPDTMRVLQTERCGFLTCWTRYVLVGGKRRGESRACELSSGDYASDGIVTPPKEKP
jgi:hypothetical protein